MRIVKSLAFLVLLAFATTSLAVAVTGCEQKAEEKKDDKKKDEKKEEAKGEEAAEGEEAAAEGEEAAAEGEEVAAADAPAGNWGESCNAYFAEVEKACASPSDVQKASCDAWVQSINMMKQNAPADATAAQAMEAGCQQGAEAAKMVIATWQ